MQNSIKTIDDLIQEASNGNLKEHKFPNVELKRSWDMKYGEKISALANKLGDEPSWMVIGIENDGTGAKRTEHWTIQTEEIISQHVNLNLDPVQACAGMRIKEVNGSWIIVMKIINPGSMVYWQHEPYKRTGTTSQIMKPEEAMELTMKLPGLKDYSKQIWTGSIDEKLATLFVKNLIKIRNELSSYYDGDEKYESLIKFFKAIRISDTNTMRLLFGDCKYRAVFYDDKGEPIRNEQRYGLYGILTDAFIEEVQNWVRKPNFLVEMPFPNKALKEGFANAVAHAAFFESDGEIIIEVYVDKIVISNLCMRESTYFANRWFSRSHKTNNGLLMETLRLAGIVDELGRGKNLIFSESIKQGKNPPFVGLEKAGRYERWRLNIYGGITNRVQLRLYQRIKEVYTNEQKALIAYALVLWKKQPVTTIKNYIDSDAVPLFAEVMGDVNGPIFYYEKADEIVLHRWVRILLEEGKDSKSLTQAEEEQLYKLTYDIQTKYHNDFMTTKEFRALAHMGDTKSEITMSSNLLKKWVVEGKLQKVRKGTYIFIKKVPEATEISKLIEMLMEKNL